MFNYVNIFVKECSWNEVFDGLEYVNSAILHGVYDEWYFESELYLQYIPYTDTRTLNSRIANKI